MIENLHDTFLTSSGVSTDTRAIKHNCIFFALKGGNFNGNAFAQKALKNGASLCVVDEKEYFDSSKNMILVEDCLKTLQELATYHRLQLDCPVIALTGSNGKTTTKELIKSVLAKKFNVQATKGNFNNHIGVPLTLLSFPLDCEIAIVEMGANHEKEIELLSYITKPDFGLITNIGVAHIEGFGSIEGIIRGKTELYNFLKENNGKVFLNADDDLLSELSKGLETINYGTNQNNYCKGNYINSEPFVLFDWTCKGKGGKNIQSNLIGSYNYNNILASVCIGNYFEVPAEEINAAIESYYPDNNRSQVVKKDNLTIILDAYNANPSSMNAAIENFTNMKSPNKFFILGDMFELGNTSNVEHEKIVQLLKKNNLKGVLVGAAFQEISQDSFTSFKTTNELKHFFKENPFKEGLVLIKGSRGIKLEPVVDWL